MFMGCSSDGASLRTLYRRACVQTPIWDFFFWCTLVVYANPPIVDFGAPMKFPPNLHAPAPHD